MHSCTAIFGVATLAGILFGLHELYPLEDHATWYYDQIHFIGLFTLAFLDGSRLRKGHGLELPQGQGLTGKVAVITGSTKGIGFQAARRFHSHGAHVVLSGRKRMDVDSAAAYVRSYSEAAGRAFGGTVADPARPRRFQVGARLRGRGVERIPCSRWRTFCLTLRSRQRSATAPPTRSTGCRPAGTAESWPRTIWATSF
ncbi:unnamed protein product [Prorocentrum cordatum]|uniref:Protochlorophyllide reductase n=1 Tax=Prorocentrum cordatum TaxID=2364126 RepID=A0ABN9PRD0_9DINO|nr:unnamed protein product [Polarella glacialis]